jgi:two-component system, NtrC family, response regulator HydG
MKILIVDDESISLTSVRRLLKWRGFRDVDICDNGTEAISKIKASEYDVVLLDLLMPEVDGLQVIEATKPYRPHTEFIILTAVDDIPTTVKAMRMGAYDYLVKPVDNERLLLSIERAYERKGLLIGLHSSTLKQNGTLPAPFADIITQCPRLKSLIAYASVMAKSGNPIMITGESGTGKELMARGIHRTGPSPEGPFIAVNVCAIPETMFETQFFGHTRGAFTGAEANYHGYFEQADGGTLFLDEIGELPLGLQAKLLRVLEEKTITLLGGSKSIHVNTRVISATNMELEKACQEGRFRLDLMYRLKSAHIHIPPLKERPGDIPVLASHFLITSCDRFNKNIHGFSPEAMEIINLKEYPGNVRELSQFVENAVILCDEEVILPHHLGASAPFSQVASRCLCSLKENDEIHLFNVLTHVAGDKKLAANILGITVRQLQRKLATMRLDKKWADRIRDL